MIRLEDVLRRLETFGLSRDPDNYAFTVFGTPGPSAPWGWRVEGHHLSLNFTLVPGRPVAMTPAFFGANPAEVPSGPQKGQRVLAAEQDLGRALARSLGEAQRARGIIAAQSLGDIVSGPGRGDSLAAPAGLALADMSGDQRAQALRLVEEFARNMRAELADQELSRMRQAGVEQIRFAWAGPLEPGKAHYYRLHGPTLLIEYDNTQNDANHIHSVWHDPRQRLRAGSAPRPLPARTPSARLSGRRIYREETTRRWGVGFREGGGGAAGAGWAASDHDPLRIELA